MICLHPKNTGADRDTEIVGDQAGNRFVVDGFTNDVGPDIDLIQCFINDGTQPTVMAVGNEILILDVLTRRVFFVPRADDLWTPKSEVPA